jgi:hypothetical protein
MNDFWEQLKLAFARLFRRGQHGVETMREDLDRRTRIQRLVAQARGLARERNALVTTLGKKVYALHQRGKIKNRDVLSDCLRLDEIRTEIEALKRKIEEIRLADMGEMPPVDLEDDSALAEEEPEEEMLDEAAETAPVQADGPAPEKKRRKAKPAPEVDQEESGEDGAGEPAGV